MKKLEIMPHDRMLGYYCDFTHRGKAYYASLCNVPGIGSECMIFPAGEWGELYCNRYIPITPQELENCIHEFIASLDE